MYLITAVAVECGFVATESADDVDPQEIYGDAQHDVIDVQDELAE